MCKNIYIYNVKKYKIVAIYNHVWCNLKLFFNLEFIKLLKKMLKYFLINRGFLQMSTHNIKMFLKHH